MKAKHLLFTFALLFDEGEMTAPGGVRLSLLTSLMATAQAPKGSSMGCHTCHEETLPATSRGMP